MIIALVFLFIFFSISFGSIFRSFNFISTKTGFAPLIMMQLAVDVKVYEGIITSSSFFKSINIAATSSALEQLCVN